jgi:hypothetical protein
MRILVVLLVVARAAQAQPVGEVGEHDDARSADSADPLATGAADTFRHLDAELRLTIDNLGSKIVRVERSFQLGGRARVVLQGAWREVDHDVSLRGWHAALSGSYDIAGISIAGTVGVEHVDTDIGKHSLRTVGIAVGKGFRVSKTARGWIGVVAGTRQWLRRPPPLGESDASQIMLTAKLSY